MKAVIKEFLKGTLVVICILFVEAEVFRVLYTWCFEEILGWQSLSYMTCVILILSVRTLGTILGWNKVNLDVSGVEGSTMKLLVGAFGKLFAEWIMVLLVYILYMIMF